MFATCVFYLPIYYLFAQDALKCLTIKNNLSKIIEPINTMNKNNVIFMIVGYNIAYTYFLI